jgi:hypothetical protein
MTREGQERDQHAPATQEKNVYNFNYINVNAHSNQVYPTVCMRPQWLHIWQ